MKKNSIFLFFRLAVGALFILSGFQKLIAPYQNFLYVIESYQILPSPLIEEFLARSMPWVEFFIGVFIILGLWLGLSLRLAAVMFFMFIIILAQALIRKLPVTECGCFGEKLSLPLPAMIVLDSFSFIVTIILAKNLNLTGYFSLDHYFAQSEKV